MLTASKLEQIIELENNLKEQYQTKIDAQAAEMAGHIADKETFIKKNEEQRAVIAKQLEQITTLSKEATANKQIEQKNREISNRAEKLQDELSESKKRVKALQKDLAKEREELKALKQFDPVKMKKNLDTAKKKAAEKQAATDLLQKTLSKTKGEKAELELKVKELEAKLEELEPAEEDTDVAAEDKAESAAA